MKKIWLILAISMFTVGCAKGPVPDIAPVDSGQVKMEEKEKEKDVKIVQGMGKSVGEVITPILEQNEEVNEDIPKAIETEKKKEQESKELALQLLEKLEQEEREKREADAAAEQALKEELEAKKVEKEKAEAEQAEKELLEKNEVKPEHPFEWKDALEKEILAVTNRYREQEGVSPLVWDESLRTSARAHNEYIYTARIFEHTKVFNVGENLYRLGTNNVEKFTAEYIVKKWWESPGHKANLLDPRYTKMGAGVLVGQMKHPTIDALLPCLYATQHFYY